MKKISLTGILSLKYKGKGLQSRQAFTLVELIVVITILAILGTIAFISLQGYSADARDGVRISDIKNAETGLELFVLTAGKYPVPDDMVSYTGGTSEIKQGIVGENVTRNMGLDRIIKDPLTDDNYVYSVFGDGQYYQIAVDQEDIDTVFIQPTYAATPVSSIVKGNYKFDPSLPSLILIPSSVTGSGIFDPNVCFVVDGGKNTLNNCVEKKSEMSLNEFENNLLGYWDMETLTIDGKLKDLSGNGYNGNPVGLVVPGNTIGIIGKATYFSGSNYFTVITSGTKLIMDYPYDNLTLEGYFKLNNVVDDGIGCEFNTYSPAISAYRYNLFSNRGSFVANSIGTVTEGWYNVSPYDETINLDDNWRFISFVKNGTITSLYINGILVQKLDHGKLDTGGYTITDLYIGATKHCAGTGNKTYSVGIIDDVKIYNRALGDEEIRQQAMIAGF